MPDRVLYSHVYDEVRNSYIRKHCPPVQYVNEGSSRAAYACSGGKCLKVAMNKVGIAQNKQELKNRIPGQIKYSCFAQNYDFDHKICGSILTACCSVCDNNDFKYAFGVKRGLQDVFLILQHASQHEFDLNATLDEFMEMRDSHGSSAEAAGSSAQSDDMQTVYSKCANAVLDMTSANPSSGAMVLRDLVQFYADHGGADKDMALSDLTRLANWGLAWRRSKSDAGLVPVVIDSGFSKDIALNYY